MALYERPKRFKGGAGGGYENPYHKGPTGAVYESDSDFAQAAIGNAVKGLAFTGGLGAIMGAMEVPSAVVKDITKSIGLKKIGFSPFSGDLVDQGLHKAGLEGKFASIGKLVGTTLSALNPIGGPTAPITKSIGAILGDAIGDVLDMREGELYRDALEMGDFDNPLTAEEETLGDVLDLSREEDMLSVGLEIEGLGKLAAKDTPEVKKEEDKDSFLSRMTEGLGDFMDGISSRITYGEFSGGQENKGQHFGKIGGGSARTSGGGGGFAGSGSGYTGTAGTRSGSMGSVGSTA
jgi:hypothetical protein